MTRMDVFDIKSDYLSFEVDGIVCDSWEIFQMMIEKYIADGRLDATNYAQIGCIWETVEEFVKSTYVPTSENYQGMQETI